MINGKKIITIKADADKPSIYYIFNKMLKELQFVLDYWILKCKDDTINIDLKDMFFTCEDNRLKYGDIEIIDILRNNNYAKLKYHYIIKNDNYVLDTRQMVIRNYNNGVKNVNIDLSDFFGSDVYGSTRNKRMAIREDLESTINKYVIDIKEIE